MGLTVATLADCRLEDIECDKYQLVFASAENVPVSLEYAALQINLRVQLFVASKYRLRSNERKIGRQINGNYTRGLSFGKYRVQQISTHICGRGEGFVEAISFLTEKNRLTVSLIGSICVCFCRKTVLPVFKLTYFN